jgi:hypothetical protein
MRGGGAYPIGPNEVDLIQVRVGTRDRLRLLGYETYDDAIRALFRGKTEPAPVPRPPNGHGGARHPLDLVPSVDCACTATKTVGGEVRRCRLKGVHSEHSWWSKVVAAVSWR